MFDCSSAIIQMAGSKSCTMALMPLALTSSPFAITTHGCCSISSPSFSLSHFSCSTCSSALSSKTSIAVVRSTRRKCSARKWQVKKSNLGAELNFCVQERRLKKERRRNRELRRAQRRQARIDAGLVPSSRDQTPKKNKITDALTRTHIKDKFSTSGKSLF